MNGTLILIFWIRLYASMISCDCKTIKDLEEAQKSSFEHYDLIFIGKVTAINSDGSYQLKVVELFKGNVTDSTIVGGTIIDYCSRFPYENDEIWLVYTNKYQNGTITIPDCGLSRSYTFPFYSGSDYLPPPPPRLTHKNEAVERLSDKIRSLEMHKQALAELRYEIEQLRKWK